MTAARQQRSQATQAALMQAAEKLIAQHGIENVSIRNIVIAAGQKNESALQYHFNNLQGLLNAIHGSRGAQTRAKREALMAELLHDSTNPSLRELCVLMVRPTFELAQADPGFRRYVKAFGHELALTEESALAMAGREGAGGASGKHLAEMLRVKLGQLDEAGFQRRMDSAVRFCAASMSHQARQKKAFRSAQAELFYSALIDALVGLLSAPESADTRALSATLSPSKPSV